MCSKYNIKWMKHNNHIQNTLSSILQRQTFCDVTLASEGKQFKAHQFVLSVCSSYFEAMLLDAPVNSHPIIFLCNVSPEEIQLLLDYMYKGEIDVPRELMNKFLKTCQNLKMIGISVDDDSTEVIENNDEFNSGEIQCEEITDSDPLEGELNQTSGNNRSESPNSFVFTLEASRDNVIPTSSEPLLMESTPEIIELSDESPNIINEVFNIFNGPDIAKSDFEDEDFHLYLSESNSPSNSASDDSELIVRSRVIRHKAQQMKYEAIQKAAALKITLDKINNCHAESPDKDARGNITENGVCLSEDEVITVDEALMMPESAEYTETLDEVTGVCTRSNKQGTIKTPPERKKKRRISRSELNNESAMLEQYSKKNRGDHTDNTDKSEDDTPQINTERLNERGIEQATSRNGEETSHEAVINQLNSSGPSRTRSKTPTKETDVFLTKVLESPSDVPLKYLNLYCPQCKRCVKKSLFTKHLIEHTT